MLHRDIFTVEGILKPFGCHGYLLKKYYINCYGLMEALYTFVSAAG